MIDPPPLADIKRPASWQVKKAPSRLIDMTRRHSAKSRSSVGLFCEIPALAITALSRSKTLFDAGRVADIPGNQHKIGMRLVKPCWDCSVEHRNTRASALEGQCHSQTETGTSSGHQNILTIQNSLCAHRTPIKSASR